MKVRQIIEDVILIILFILAVGMIIWYIFGDSPTFEQTLIVAIIAYLFSLNTRLSKIESETRLIHKSFNSLASDFKSYISDHK